MSANIFISFAGQDLKVAFTLCKALESRGFKCWISSRDILPGENFQVAIVRAIRTAKMMLLVFTGNSNNSEEMTKELALASQHKLIVVPLRIEDVAPNDAFAYEFATRQWIDFFADWETAINQLSERIAQAIPADAGPAPAPVSEPLPPPNPHIEPVAIPPAALEPEPPKPAPPPVAPATAPAPAVAAAPAAEAAVATIDRPAAAELKQPEAKPAPEPVKAAAAPAAPAARPAAPAKPAAPAAKLPDAKAPAVAPGEKKKAPVGLFVGIGVVVLALIGAAVVLPGMLGNKPAAKAPVVVAASHPAVPTAPATPLAAAPVPVATGSSGVIASPAATDANAQAAAGGNTLAAPPAPPKPRHVVVRPKVTSHHETEVPF